MSDTINKYLRRDRLPHIWCPGCGHGMVLNALLRAFSRIEIDQNKTVIVSGIGCASRAVTYLDFNTMHTTHGRALSFATGIKQARPDLRVIVLMGDGDAIAIGGNHFIHTARRNLDITAIVFNNGIYGMTGGQTSPTTPLRSMTTTTPLGSVARPFDVCSLAVGAGATYVARGTAFHIMQLSRYLETALKHRGFSVVDAISQCPVAYGRRNRMPEASEMMRWQKQNAVSIQKATNMADEDLSGRIVIGEFIKLEVPEHADEHSRLADAAQAGSI